MKTILTFTLSLSFAVLWSQGNKPSIDCIDHQIYPVLQASNEHPECSANIILEAKVHQSTECTLPDKKLYLTAYVDLYGNGTTDYEFSSFLTAMDDNLENDTNNNGIADIYVAPVLDGATVVLPSFVLPYEITSHRVSWKVSDACGEVSGCETMFSVVDDAPPVIKFRNLIAPITVNVETVITAIDFDSLSTDNCTEKNKLIFTFNETFPVMTKLNLVHYFKDKGIEASPGEYMAGHAQKWEPALQSSTLRVGCNLACSDQLETVFSVWDKSLNLASQHLSFDIEKKYMYCDPTTQFTIKVTTVKNKPLNRVLQISRFGVFPEVVFNDSTSVSYFGCPSSGCFKLVKDDDVQNGINHKDLIILYQHLKGTKVITDPLLLLAADINDDKQINNEDLILLKKMVTGMSKSKMESDWLFVPNTTTFPDPTQPWIFDWSSYHCPDVSNAYLKFIAFKRGDLDYNAYISE